MWCGLLWRKLTPLPPDPLQPQPSNLACLESANCWLQRDDLDAREQEPAAEAVAPFYHHFFPTIHFPPVISCNSTVTFALCKKPGFKITSRTLLSLSSKTVIPFACQNLNLYFHIKQHSWDFLNLCQQLVIKKENLAGVLGRQNMSSNKTGSPAATMVLQARCIKI